MADNRLNPVAWVEGMFLRPHHLQHQEVYETERLRFHLGAVDPFHWGIRALEIDEKALTDNRLVINRLEAILPGGIPIRYPGNAIVEVREFDPTIEKSDVYIGVRHLSLSEPNSSPDSVERPDTRFSLRTHKVMDLHRGGYESEVVLAHPNVRIFFEGETNALELHEAMKIGEIRKTEELARPFELSPEWAPPLLAIEAWPPLLERVNKIVNQMAQSIRVVVGRTQTLSTGDLPRYWMRYTLARLTPVLRHQLATGFTRPFELYMALLEAASALSAFKATEAVRLPTYDHMDLMHCFQEVIKHIDAHVGESLPTRFKEIKLRWEVGDSGGMYVTNDLNQQLVDPRNLVYAAVKAPMDSKELAQLVVQQGKAGSARGLRMLIQLNIGGLRIEHLPAAPTEIAGPPGFEYFRIETHGAQWNKVREEFGFGLYLGRLEGADVRLYVVTPEG